MSCTDLCVTPTETCVAQGGSFTYQATLRSGPDDDDPVVLLADLTSLTLRLTNRSDGDVINLRDQMDVKNTNGGTYHATSGLFTMEFEGDDNEIIDTNKRKEEHVALFEATWDSGTKSLRWPLLIEVDNLDKLAGSAPSP